MFTTSILINHKTGKLKAYWEQKDEIEKASDEDPMLPNVHYLIKVSDEKIYFDIDPFDIIMFMYKGSCHAGTVTFKDYCDKDNKIIKVKSFLACPTEVRYEN